MLAPLEAMLTELLRIVLLDLSLISIMSLKFVSREVREKMKREDGEDFIDAKRLFAKAHFEKTKFSTVSNILYLTSDETLKRRTQCINDSC